MKTSFFEYLHIGHIREGAYMQVSIKTIEEEMVYRNQPVLTYTIQYPEVSSAVFKTAAVTINRYYRAKADLYRQRLRHSLYHQAIRELENTKENPDIPFRPFEAYLGCTIAYNENCMLSLYFDAYQFTGGAHGNTTRTSDTWDLGCGRRVTMARFFKPGATYKAYVINTVNEQISAQMETGNGMYFEDFDTNAARHFNPGSFYLVPEGLVVYYQQYQIAPYASGIPEFLLPFSKEVQRPQCRKAPNPR